MRLLNVRTKKLEEYFERPNEIPDYAILSHTWGKNELVYRDVKKGGYKAGLSSKIDGCCTQAELDGYHFVWIDTICIDKRSSAELSEAINSMFKWYERAKVCYVYLTDVRDLDGLKSSRWFTRGWTLQELLAPFLTQFFNANWQKLDILYKSIFEPNMKTHKFASLLSDITGINIKYLLHPFRPGSSSIARKMTWAAHRQTSRPEDKAYSLLGLFGVNMPLLYGEGDRAFRRLQGELLRISDDDSIFAWGYNRKEASWTFFTPFLATCPDDFIGCENVGIGHSQGSHYFMTNLGVHVTLPSIELPSELNKAAGNYPKTILVKLGCRDESLAKYDPRSNIVLVLLQVAGSDNRYRRCPKSQDQYHTSYDAPFSPVELLEWQYGIPRYIGDESPNTPYTRVLELHSTLFVPQDDITCAFELYPAHLQITWPWEESRLRSDLWNTFGSSSSKETFPQGFYC